MEEVCDLSQGIRVLQMGMCVFVVPKWRGAVLGVGEANLAWLPIQLLFAVPLPSLPQGLSTDASVQEGIGVAARNASRVMVLLDSDHSAENVAAELEMYCQRFVTVGAEQLEVAGWHVWLIARMKGGWWCVWW